jgi:hypothetical protein
MHGRLSGALAIVAGLLWPASAFCQEELDFFISGNQLYKQCSFPLGSADRAFCLGYVAGIADAFGGDGSACVPKEVTLQQATDVIMNELRAVPRYRHITASLLAGAALGKAFRCSSK